MQATGHVTFAEIPPDPKDYPGALPYFDDDGHLVALRQGDYKYVFSEQRKEGTIGVWAEPFTTLRLQKIFNLMQDPFERADITSNNFWDWQINPSEAPTG